MHELNEHRVRTRVGRILGRAAKLFCCSLQRSASRTSPMPARMAGAAVFTAVVAFIAAVFTAAVASMTAAFTLARFTVDLADFMAADGMVASRASTMVSATATATTGTTAGATGVTVGGGVMGSDGLTIHMDRITIRTTATTAPASPAPRRTGTTAPIPRATTLT